jgi:ABC-type transport system substrate-binding protein
MSSQKSGGTLRFVPHADLKVLDPVWTTAYKMKYTFTLRDGLEFHDGQPVTAEDCVASIKRWGARGRADWARETEPAKQKQLADQIQQLAYEEVPYVSWGQFVIPAAFRKNVQGVLQFGVPLLWNISV